MICHETPFTKLLCCRNRSQVSYKHFIFQRILFFFFLNKRHCDPLIYKDIVAKKQLAPIWALCLIAKRAFVNADRQKGTGCHLPWSHQGLMLCLLCPANHKPCVALLFIIQFLIITGGLYPTHCIALALITRFSCYQL